ncbi:MAG: hypothetical protein R3E48_14010 [Burkholderiaceae bacterium]
MPDTGPVLPCAICRTICYYCGCNKIGTRHQDRSAPYIEALKRELDLVAAAIGERQTISHLHFGGGTPTFLLDSEFADACSAMWSMSSSARRMASTRSKSTRARSTRSGCENYAPWA